MTTEDFADEVGKAVESDYGLLDGDDLCYNLVELGRIDMADGVENAARVVAQHIAQP